MNYFFQKGVTIVYGRTITRNGAVIESGDSFATPASSPNHLKFNAFPPPFLNLPFADFTFDSPLQAFTFTRSSLHTPQGSEFSDGFEPAWEAVAYDASENEIAKVSGGPNTSHFIPARTYTLEGDNIASVKLFYLGGLADTFSIDDIVLDKPQQKQSNIVPTSLTWNTAQGGVDFGYKVEGGDLTQDTTATLYWAMGPSYSDARKKIPNASYTIPMGTKAQSTPYTQHVNRGLLKNAVQGTTHLLVVLGDPASSTFDPVNDVKALEDVQLRLPNNPTFPLSQKTVERIKGLLRESGQGDRVAIVTSTVRTPRRQAEIMYDNLEKGTGRNYREPGKKVIAVYDSMKREGLSDRTLIIEKMRKEIVKQGPYRVSHHCADQRTWSNLQVVDIDPDSITNPIRFRAYAKREKAQGNLANFLDPSKDDPAFHFEVTQ